MSSLVERVEINYPLEKDWLSCATVAPAFFSVSIRYISSWCWLTSTYLNILIWFSIEVLHHAFHLQKVQLNKKYCYIAGNFFLAARALIGYFEVRWHLTMKLFPAKISERATLQNLWRQVATVHDHPRMLSWPTTAVTARFYEFSASKFRVRQHWDSRETKLTVSLRTNQYSSVYYCGHGDCLVRENKND